MARLIRNSLAVVALLSVAICLRAQDAEVIDRIIATVNHAPVLQSEWEDSLRYEAFLQGRPLQSFSEEERRGALSRLIDRVLLQQQMQADYSPSPDEVAERVKDIRSQLNGAESDAAWRDSLQRYGLDETSLRESIENQLKILRFVDLRLRPTIRIGREDISEYYKNKLVPDLERAGVVPEPIEKVTARIREILVQQRMEAVLEDWLVNLRSQSEIHYELEHPAPAGSPEQKTSEILRKEAQR